MSQPQLDQWPLQSIILFSHLIPCCQNFTSVESEEERNTLCEFETHMDFQHKVKQQSNKHKELIEYLISHPCNRTHPAPQYHIHSKYGNLCTPRLHQGKETVQQITWERILSLIRNIFCHEPSRHWQCLSDLIPHLIDYFGSLDAISDMIKAYYDIVLQQSRYLSACPFYKFTARFNCLLKCIVH